MGQAQLDVGQRRGREPQNQPTNGHDLTTDSTLNPAERAALQDALKARQGHDNGVKHSSESTKEGYQRNSYQRSNKELNADERSHGYAPSHSEKRFTGRDTDQAPRAEADVKFRFNRSDLTPEAERAVADVSAEINRIRRENNGEIPKGTTITVHGHTDSIGDASYNQTLSEQRAKAAKDAIVKATGVDPELIAIVGHGEKNPIASNTSRDGRAKNRRVEIDVRAPVTEKEPTPASEPEQKKQETAPAPLPEQNKEATPHALAPIKNPSLIPLPEKPTLAQTREWSESNMRNYNELDPAGRKAFEQQIQDQYKAWGDKEPSNPSAFFDRQVSDAAARELKEATRSRVEYYSPLTTSRVPAPIQSRVVTEPDPIKIHEVLRSVSDLPGVMSDLKTNPEVAAVRNSLPQKQNWFSREDGVHQEAIDARLRGDTAKAEAIFLRSLIENHDIRDLEKAKKAITGALGTNPDLKEGIKESYQDSFGTDLVTDLKKAHAPIVEPE